MYKITNDTCKQYSIDIQFIHNYQYYMTFNCLLKSLILYEILKVFISKSKAINIFKMLNCNGYIYFSFKFFFFKTKIFDFQKCFSPGPGPGCSTDEWQGWIRTVWGWGPVPQVWKTGVLCGRSQGSGKEVP